MKRKKYTYTIDGGYFRSSGIYANNWVVKSPHGRTIAETIGKGSAKKITEALNKRHRNCTECGKILPPTICFSCRYIPIKEGA